MIEDLKKYLIYYYSRLKINCTTGLTQGDGAGSSKFNIEQALYPWGGAGSSDNL
ncbi:MAG: hypothetical protein F6K25_28645 [Okeania sp. SIO2G4]|uniref:hypothetical protein n=1 Tax=unclassified Okeania TaxID=2634635 RepID=UPI0013B82ED2|nr:MULTISPECIES: hypothetical protein [unclassified Okeania]NEP75562.1 hypothetical protein [Okeania sp. SIO2G5]NEP96698.1 hypothetical protein [Okeania sp. SIO2F5]NEQ94408.1 hypothetical protein [Okeania sp. SIO2G4]